MLETVHLLLAQPTLPGDQACASAATERVVSCTSRRTSCRSHRRPDPCGMASFLAVNQPAACKANPGIEGLLSQAKEREANRAGKPSRAAQRGGALDALLALALGSGGVPSPAVRSQV